jgi:threonine/homoserine/homoserine lactone efflux protein
MTWTTFAAFLIAVALGAMVPGSTTALVIRQARSMALEPLFPS